MTIYFVGSLFNEAEKKFNQELTEKLETLGFEVIDNEVSKITFEIKNPFLEI